MSPPKAYFAAIPARALLDRRLDGGRFQLLAAIALSNRLGKGQGCWRSAATLATMTGLSAGTIKNYIGDLIAWGYVLREERPGTKTHRSLFVIYDVAADRAAAFQPVISRSDGFESNPSSAEGQPVISGNDPSKSLERKIAQSAESEIPQKRRRPKMDGADALSHPQSAMAGLKLIERRLASRPSGTWTEADETELQELAGYCDDACDVYDSNTGEPIGGMAYRLAQDLGWELSNLMPTEKPCATPPTSGKLDKWPTGQKKFGPWLAERRNESGVQMRDLADALGIRAADLYEIETGRVGLGGAAQRKAVAYLRERTA